MTSPEAEPDEPQDELKQRFLAALERKRGRETEANSTEDGRGQSKIHGAHGPARSKRSTPRTPGCSRPTRSSRWPRDRR